MGAEEEKKKQERNKVSKSDAKMNEKKKSQARLAMLAKARPQTSASLPMYGRLTAQEMNDDAPSSPDMLKSKQDDTIQNEKKISSDNERNQRLSLASKAETEYIQPSPSTLFATTPQNLETTDQYEPNWEDFQHSYGNTRAHSWI